MSSKGLLTLTLASGLGLTAYSQSFLTNGLVAYYPFNGNANDASGNGNDGIVQGANLIADRFGLTNRAFSFDGATSRIVIPETIFAATNTECTVSAWVLAGPEAENRTEVILQKSGHNGTMTMQINSGVATFGPKLANGNWYWATSPVSVNATHHLVGVYKRAQHAELYIDGVLKSTKPLPNSDLFLDPVYPLLSAIGIYDYTPAPGYGFKGTIDDVRIYTRALSESEVQLLFSLESPFRLDLIKAVKPAFSGMLPGTNYQMQVSSDAINWTNEGASFTATNTSLVYPQYFDVENWNQLFFRIQIAQ